MDDYTDKREDDYPFLFGSDALIPQYEDASRPSTAINQYTIESDNEVFGAGGLGDERQQEPTYQEALIDPVLTIENTADHPSTSDSIISAEDVRDREEAAQWHLAQTAPQSSHLTNNITFSVAGLSSRAATQSIRTNTTHPAIPLNYIQGMEIDREDTRPSKRRRLSARRASRADSIVGIDSSHHETSVSATSAQLARQASSSHAGPSRLPNEVSGSGQYVSDGLQVPWYRLPDAKQHYKSITDEDERHGLLTELDNAIATTQSTQPEKDARKQRKDLLRLRDRICNHCAKLYDAGPKDARRCQDRHGRVKCACPRCGKPYSRRDNMLRHHRKAHSNDPLPSVDGTTNDGDAIAMRTLMSPVSVVQQRMSNGHRLLQGSESWTVDNVINDHTDGRDAISGMYSLDQGSTMQTSPNGRDFRGSSQPILHGQAYDQYPQDMHLVMARSSRLHAAMAPLPGILASGHADEQGSAVPWPLPNAPQYTLDSPERVDVPPSTGDQWREGFDFARLGGYGSSTGWPQSHPYYQ